MKNTEIYWLCIGLFCGMVIGWGLGTIWFTGNPVEKVIIKEVPTLKVIRQEVLVEKIVTVDRWSPLLSYQNYVTENLTVEQGLLFIKELQWTHQYYIDHPSDNPLAGSKIYNTRVIAQYEELAELIRRLSRIGGGG